jgi:prophage maintenance system killer protein
MPPVQAWEEILTLDRLMSLHASEMIHRGQTQGIPKQGCLEGALGNAWSAEQYQPSELQCIASGLAFACFSLQYLAQNHCMPDGNKRIAWIAFVEILATIQLTVDVAQDEAAMFVEQVVMERLGGSEIMGWAEARLRFLMPPL